MQKSDAVRLRARKRWKVLAEMKLMIVENTKGEAECGELQLDRIE